MGLAEGFRPPRLEICKIVLDNFYQVKYNNIMDLVAEHLGKIILTSLLVFGFILIIYTNAEHLPRKRDEDDEGWF